MEYVYYRGDVMIGLVLESAQSRRRSLSIEENNTVLRTFMKVSSMKNSAGNTVFLAGKLV